MLKHIIRFALFNPLSLARDYRALQIASVLDVDAVALPGIGEKIINSTPHWTQKLDDDRWALHFG